MKPFHIGKLFQIQNILLYYFYYTVCFRKCVKSLTIYLSHLHQSLLLILVSDGEYRSSTDRLSNFIFSSLPPFDLSKVNGVTEECKRQSKIYINDLKKFKLWALQSKFVYHEKFINIRIYRLITESK